ncbi:unnamed protein product, partial [Lampetra planeri]
MADLVNSPIYFWLQTAPVTVHRSMPSDAWTVSSIMPGTWSGATPLFVLLLLSLVHCQEVPLVPGDDVNYLMVSHKADVTGSCDPWLKLPHVSDKNNRLVSVKCSGASGNVQMEIWFFFFLVFLTQENGTDL